MMKLLTTTAAFSTAALLALTSSAQVTDPGVGGGPDIEVPALDGAERETLLTLLSSYHGLPPAVQFEESLTDPSSALFALLSEPELNPIFFDRAVAALAYWPSDAVRALYDALLEEPGREMVRHRVMGHYAQAFGDAAVPAVAPYLESGDVQLRLTAVSVLGGMQAPAAQDALLRAAERESDATVLQQIERATTLR